MPPSNKKKMPRRSPRNHNSSKAADMEIAARLTTLHIYEVQHGAEEVQDEERGRGGTKSEHRQPYNHQHQLPVPPLRVSWADVSNIMVLGSCACLMAVRAVFLYRHISKQRRQKEARLVESAGTETELGMLSPSHRITMNPQWSQGGPRPGIAYHTGGNTDHNALPFILAMARRHKEQEFQRGVT